MATHLHVEIRRLKNLVKDLSGEIDEKNHRVADLSTSLSRMAEERYDLNQAFDEEKRKVRRAMVENGRLNSEIGTLKKEIEKRDAELGFKNKQLVILRELTKKKNIEPGKSKAKENRNSREKVQVTQVQLDMNGPCRELGEKDYEMDGELNLNQMPVDKELNLNHDAQEVPKVQPKRKRKTAPRKCKAKKTTSSKDKVQVNQVQFDMNGPCRELEENDCELGSELNPNQTQIDKEHMSNHDVQEVCTVPIKLSRKRKSVPRKFDANKNMSRENNVQVHFDMNGFCNEMEEEECELGSELNLNQTLIDQEHMSNHDLQEAQEVFIEEVRTEDDENLTQMIEWGKGNIDGNEEADMFPPIPPPESLVNPCNSSDISDELPPPDDDIAELEWLTTFAGDSSSAGRISLDVDFTNYNKNDDSCQLPTSTSAGEIMPLSPDAVVPGRAQRKTARPAILDQSQALSLVSPTSCRTSVPELPMTNSYLTENDAESHPPYTPKSKGKEKMKKRLPPCQQSVPGKKCLHCEVTKTPQWRQGPLGPKTLCNACGVRYKSGRLCPEYRPANSPTFVASIHSNSHRKVLEMRGKGTPNGRNRVSSAIEYLPEEPPVCLITYK